MATTPLKVAMATIPLVAVRATTAWLAATAMTRSTATPAINRVLQIDPNNPVIIGLQALVADKSNDSINARKLIEQANSISDLSTIGDTELSKQFLDLLAKQP